MIVIRIILKDNDFLVFFEKVCGKFVYVIILYGL